MRYRNCIGLFNQLEDARQWSPFVLQPFTPQILEPKRDSAGNYLFVFKVPGFELDEIEMEVEEDYLVVRAEKKNEDSDMPKEEKYLSSVSLPKNADLDNISAVLRLGILKVTIPTVDKKRKIEIK